ncbi:hypothetical protein K7432_004447 [Basidiobolus ranarum]|uniref:Uncharacterized protein n=1 Tax=Basidiobolus ranarum TaxID=34480 RepID=A0ABR2W5J2_9FUNG
MKNHLIFVYLALCISTALAYLAGDSCEPTDSLSKKGPCQNETLACDDSTNKCVLLGCRIDEPIFDWPSNLPQPPICNSTEYCPDSLLKCLPKTKLGDICSINRDESCEGENGTCLNQRCVAKNVPLGQQCIIDSISAYLNNRDNCLTGLFCSTNNGVCVSALENDEPCSEDRQCHSGNCKSNICQNEVEYNHFPTWGYILIVVGCVVVIASCLLFIYLRRRRRMNAYKKSVADLRLYRQSVISNSTHGNASSTLTNPSTESGVKVQSFSKEPQP